MICDKESRPSSPVTSYLFNQYFMMTAGGVAPLALRMFFIMTLSYSRSARAICLCLFLEV